MVQTAGGDAVLAVTIQVPAGGLRHLSLSFAAPGPLGIDAMTGAESISNTYVLPSFKFDDLTLEWQMTRAERYTRIAVLEMQTDFSTV